VTLLAPLSLLTAAALVVRLGQLGWVVGEVGPAASPALAHFVRQKTVLVTASISAASSRPERLDASATTPRVEVKPSTARGRPTGPGLQATARRLEAAESRRAARLLARKHPLLHGVLLPLTHRLGRASRTGKTIHSS